MRIDQNPVGQTAPAPGGRAAETRPAGMPDQGNSEENKGDADRVEISALGSRIAETLEDNTGDRAQHIGALQADVQAGTYKVDSRALSQALIEQALSAAKPQA